MTSAARAPGLWLALALSVAGVLRAAGAQVDPERVRAAFVEVHGGFSADEVLVQEELNAAFLGASARLHGRAEPPAGDPAFARESNRALLNLRKAGALSGPDAATTRRHAARPGAPPLDAYRHAAEVAARRVTDRSGATLDGVLCDPRLRAAFAQAGREAAGPVPGLRDEDLRRAALALRKARRLRPELVARVADWGRTLGHAPAEGLAAAFAAGSAPVPAAPGVYLLSDASGYLYIGEAADLAARLARHLSASDRAALRHHLLGEGLAGVTVEWHAFDPGSDARLARYRRAYESDLIASRAPRFNLRP